MAKNKSRNQTNNKGGRPSDYKPAYNKQAEKLCKLGATDKELAEFFEVSEKTLNNWKKEHPNFLQSIKRGKIISDAEVADKLYQRAIGYEHKEDKIFQYEGSPVIVPTKKIYAPDPTAAIFWLKNRQKDKWRDKQDLEHSGPNGGPIETKSQINIYIPDNNRDVKNV